MWTFSNEYTYIQDISKMNNQTPFKNFIRKHVNTSRVKFSFFENFSRRNFHCEYVCST